MTMGLSVNECLPSGLYLSNSFDFDCDLFVSNYLSG